MGGSQLTNAQPWAEHKLLRCARACALPGGCRGSSRGIGKGRSPFCSRSISDPSCSIAFLRGSCRPTVNFSGCLDEQWPDFWRTGSYLLMRMGSFPCHIATGTEQDGGYGMTARAEAALAAPRPFPVKSRSQVLAQALGVGCCPHQYSSPACSLLPSFHPEKTWTRPRTGHGPCSQSCDMSKSFCRGYTTSELPGNQSLGGFLDCTRKWVVIIFGWSISF